MLLSYVILALVMHVLAAFYTCIGVYMFEDGGIEDLRWELKCKARRMEKRRDIKGRKGVKSRGK